jgi:hypothetical protein
VLEGITAVVEQKGKDKVTSLEIVESFILCGHQAYNSYIKSTAAFVHEDNRFEVAPGKYRQRK